MTTKTLYKAQWLWQDYVGAKWQNLSWGNTGDDHASYVYPQGKGSKSAYRPKSLFYHYQVTGINSSKYKLDSVKFVLVIGKFNTKSNPLPSVKIFTGDNNAPYKTSALYSTSSYKSLSNKYNFDSHTMEFTIKNVTIAQLKNIIIEVDWGKTKISGASTISVNRARLIVNYSLQNPKWSLYESVNKTSATTNDKIAWKLTMKNNGYCGNNTVTLKLPKGVTVASSTGGGSYNSSTKVWSMNNICKGKSVTRTFYLKSNSVGMKELQALNNSVYATNINVIRQVSFYKYVEPIVPTVAQNRDDKVTYTFYDTFENENNQYFDVQIQGMKENHPSNIACYQITSSANVSLKTPLKTYAELLTDENNVNINSIYTNISGSGTENILCLDVIANTDFVANIRIYMSCTDDTEGTITTSDSNNSWVGTFDILEERGAIFIIDESISRDKAYVVNSVNIGSEENWTINAKAHRHNFFDERKDLMEIEIEQDIAYIGVIPLSRCHKADVTADSKNTLIENRYLNRAYYGKKGDYSEDIKMTLRIPWYDVATLQGLCEMDKPIPIDTIPNRMDGDPLNHRGWAEIHGVTNIKKINDMLYECDVEVTYLTHDILTRFTITEAKAITEANIKYYLSLIHDFNGDILDLFQLNYYEFWTTLEDVNGDKIGSYNIEPNTSLVLSRDLNKYSTYDIVWRNSLPQLMSEDYDGNWEMALRVLNKNTREILFEHKYSNFKHYDFNTSYAVNTANADTKYLVGNNYETLNYEKINLGFDGLAPLIEDSKEATHFNTMENMVIDDPSQPFEMFLLDTQNKGVGNQIITVKVVGDNNFTNSFNVITDRYGRFSFNPNWGNGNYNITVIFEETSSYRSCTYNTDMTIQFNYVEYHFSYPTNVPNYVNGNDVYTCTILDSNNNPVNNITVHYSFKDIGGEYKHEETATSNSQGEISIPIIQSTGSHILRVHFKGFTDNNTIYQPCQFEEQINVTNNRQSVIIEADDVVLMQGDNEKQYPIILKDDLENVLNNENIKFAFYNTDETFILSSKTNTYGVASVPLYLKGGAWKVDVVYEGNNTYNPLTVTKTVKVDNFVQIGTYIECDDITLNEDKLLASEQDYFKFYLYDEYDNAVVREPVNVKIYNATKTVTYIDTVFNTRDDGSVTVPFISHSENVIVEIKYKGSVRYTSSTNECKISFESIINKVTQTLSKGTRTTEVYNPNIEDNVEITEDYVQLFIGGVEQEEWQSDYCVVHSMDNERLTSDSPQMDYWITVDEWGVNNNSLPIGEFKVTIFKRGDATNYSICRTLTINTVRGSDNWVLSWIALMLDNPYEDGELTFEDLTNDVTHRVDDLRHYRFKFNFWIPNNTLVTARNGYDEDSTSYSHEYKTITRETTDSNGNKITYFDIYCQMAYTSNWHFIFDNPVVLGNFEWDSTTYDSSTTSKTAISVTQTGFAYDNKTYQDLKIDINGSDGTIQYAQGFYIIKLLNNETNEELYYYSYIYDNLNPSTITFSLMKSIKQSGNNWTMEIFVAHDNIYKSGYLKVSGRITTDTVIVTETTSIFVSEEEYIELGSDVTFTSNGFSYNGGT